METILSHRFDRNGNHSMVVLANGSKHSVIVPGDIGVALLPSILRQMF